MPIGNGRTGTLVWTTPSALKMLINRVDAHAVDSTTVSFPRADSDYGSVCGYVDIHVADSGEDVFPPGAFRQHLSLYDALLTTEGNGLKARALAWPSGDVIAIEIDDQRPQPAAINIQLRMLRYQVQYEKGRNSQLAQDHVNLFRTANHTATSRLGIHGDRISLTQHYRELRFFNSTAVAIGVLGRKARARYLNETTVQLSAVPGRGPFTILIASAASRSEQDDIAAKAVHQVDTAASKGFETLRKETAASWSDYWSKGMVYLHSQSGQADFVESNYTYYLYLMGATSRGAYPPRFGGMLWFTDGGMSRWGSQYWFANTYSYYSNLMPANRMELMDPVFRL
ncbi:MAG: glycoside hydrolase, partial [Acidobacteria bacterium]|nr:glycoside hydrolase [Acidobacteriota bacterium]